MFGGEVIGEYYMKLPYQWAGEIHPDQRLSAVPAQLLEYRALHNGKKSLIGPPVGPGCKSRRRARPRGVVRRVGDPAGGVRGRGDGDMLGR